MWVNWLTLFLHPTENKHQNTHPLIGIAQREKSETKAHILIYIFTQTPKTPKTPRYQQSYLIYQVPTLLLLTTRPQTTYSLHAAAPLRQWVYNNTNNHRRTNGHRPSRSINQNQALQQRSSSQTCIPTRSSNLSIHHSLIAMAIRNSPQQPAPQSQLTLCCRIDENSKTKCWTRSQPAPAASSSPSETPNVRRCMCWIPIQSLMLRYS